MIEKIEIENFQSHKKSELEFSNGVNVIIGKTDSGKSAIIRAIRLVADNRPSGDAYRSDWGGDTKVSLTLTEGTVVTRKKTNSLNQYSLNGIDFVAFKQDVPKEISDALALNEVNLQSQMDSPFLLSVSAGAVASHFNKCGGLSAIDKANGVIRAEVGRISKDVEFLQREKEELKEQMKQFAGIADCESTIKSVELLEIQYNTLFQSTQKIKSLLNKCTQAYAILSSFTKPTTSTLLNDTLLLLDKQKTTSTDLEKVRKSINRLCTRGQLLQESTQLHRNSEEIEALLQSYKLYQIKRRSGEPLIKLKWKILDTLSEIKEVEQKPTSDEQLLELLSVFAERKELIKKQSLLDTRILKLEALAVEGKKAQIKVKEMVEEFEHLLPAVCPLCGQSNEHTH